MLNIVNFYQNDLHSHSLISQPLLNNACGLIFHNYLHSRFTDYARQTVSQLYSFIYLKCFLLDGQLLCIKPNLFSVHGWNEPSLGYQAGKEFLKGAKATKMNSKVLSTLKLRTLHTQLVGKTIKGISLMSHQIQEF